MKHYIDKSALVAEIKKRIDCCYKICAGNLDFLQKGYPERYYSIETYKEILSFINSLEVKEVDLEAIVEEAFDKYSSVDGYGQLVASFNRAELYSFVKKIARGGE